MPTRSRRLPAEVLLDAVYRVTGSISKFPGIAPGTRAAALPDSGVELPSGFLTTFGRPARESACECERSSGLQLGPVMALVSGPTLGDAIADPNNELNKLAATQADDVKLIDELFLRILNRPAMSSEIETCRKDMQIIEDDHRRMAEDLGKHEVEFAMNRRYSSAAAIRALSLRRPLLRPTRKHRPQARRCTEKEERNHGQTRSRSQSLRVDNLRQENGRLGKEKSASILNRWLVLEPKTMSTTNGSTLTKQPDGSIVVSGPNRNGVVTDHRRN